MFNDVRRTNQCTKSSGGNYFISNLKLAVWQQNGDRAHQFPNRKKSENQSAIDIELSMCYRSKILFSEK